ncbi:MAG TPA: glycosyltransferase family 4 protein [Candidatus Acidoferrales bacterium]|nr:glycosyltransferase family 4 protein [Candidatus Acidoferrales bacterium]
MFPAFLSVGGIETAGRQTAAAFATIADSQGWHYEFFSLNDSKGEHETGTGEQRFRFRGFDRQKLRFVLAALRAARACPKIIFAAHPNLAPMAATMRFFARHARVIVGTHGIEVWTPLPHICRVSLRRADIIVAPSSDTARRLSAAQKIVETKIRRVPWPLDQEMAELARSPAGLVLPQEFPSGRVVLSVGRWAANERYKGADLLIQVFGELSKEFPGVHLVLVGQGDDLARLWNLAQESTAAHKIRFLTNLSRRELAACYVHAEIFALPSMGEGFGLVFLEAMAFEKPLIGTPFGGIPDIIDDGETGILADPRNPASVSGALRTLLSNNDLRQKLGRRAGEIVRSRYGFNQFRREWEKLLGVDERT